MIADVLFTIYLIFLVAAIGLCIHPKGIALQQEYMAWRATKDYFYRKD